MAKPRHLPEARQLIRGLMADRISREIHLAFWKIHILHHAAEHPIYGQWLLEELARHGLRVSPGTLYPLLSRMARQGWLRTVRRGKEGVSPKARREYVATPMGARVLAGLRNQVDELHREVVREAHQRRR